MANIKVCDMCGKTIEDRAHLFKTSFRIIRAILGIEFAYPKEYDLCSGCAVKVRDYIDKSISEKATDA